ncbi:MAG: resolvase [Acidimicrobiaceae bacterium]|nr:resolvase [Acidimicrobiaceae bacterium]
MPSKQRAALYHRVSTVDQDPAAARKELRVAAKRHGFRVALNIEETGSGASNSRPGLAKLIQAAGRGRIDVVLVWKLDRFGRSALDLLANLRALEDAGVRFISITQGIDLRPNGDAMSRLMLTMLGAVAEFERALISERTRLGMAKARADGKPIGRPRGPRPSAARVQRLRKRGDSWRELAAELDCSVWVAREVFKEAAEKGARKSPSKRPRKGGSGRV